MAIDWTFLQEVEGKENTAYVPMQDGKAIQNSGVTIGTGVDLGQQSKARFEKLGVSQEIIAKLDPFFGKTQDKALKALDSAGDVTLSDEEVFAVDQALKKETLRETKSWYNKNNTIGQDWADLSDRQQTVVLSVRYNHGPKGAPNFYKQVASGQWSDAIDNLRKFYPSVDNELHGRRLKEAQYLAGLPKEERDGVDGPTTAKAIETFKNTVGVSTPDQVRPEQPQIGSTAYLDNLMQTLKSNLDSSQRGSQTPSRGRKDPDQELDKLLEGSLSGVERRKAGEKKLEQTYNEVKSEEEPRKWSKKDEKAISEIDRMLSGEVIKVNQEKPAPKEKQEPVEREQDDSKDPIFGIF